MLRLEQSAASSRRRSWIRGASLFALVALIVVVFLPQKGLYASYSSGRFCASCHEIAQPFNDWHTSTHRNVECGDCHGRLFSSDVRFHLKNLHRIVAHARDQVPEQIQLNSHDVLKMGERCKSCHQEEYARWAAGPHAVTYKEIFLNEDHNRRMHLADDCLRCHGMYFGGGVRDLVTTTDTKGPWHLRDAKLNDGPAIPCLVCHQVHREAELLARRPKGEITSPSQQIGTPSLALFDRRERTSVAVTDLPLPIMHDSERSVGISPDQRQSLCYACHAPLVTNQLASGDDRTPAGVHEGISCFSCHSGHDERTRASCATCHPQFSNCGLNVETMDTTFLSAKSRHNIHSVQCVDCHSKKFPKRKPGSMPGIGAKPAISAKVTIDP